MPLLRLPIRIWRSSRNQGESAQSLLRETAECEHNDSADEGDTSVDRQLVSLENSDCQLRLDLDGTPNESEQRPDTTSIQQEQSGLTTNGTNATQSPTNGSTQALTIQPPEAQLGRPLRSPLPFPEITRYAPGSSRHTVEYLAHRRGLSRISKKRDKHIVTLFMSIICLLLLCAAAVEPRWITWSGTSDCTNNQQFYIGLTDALLQGSVGCRNGCPHFQVEHAWTFGIAAYFYHLSGVEQSCFMTVKLLVLLNVTTAFLTITFVIVLCAIALELAKPANPFLRTARRNAFCTIFGAILASVVNAVAYVASETLRVRLIETAPHGDLDAMVHVQVAFTTGFYLVAAAASCAIVQTAYVLLLSTALRRCASRCARRVRNANAVRRRRQGAPPTQSSSTTTNATAAAGSAGRATSLTRGGAFNRSFYLRDPRTRVPQDVSNRVAAPSSTAALVSDAPPPFTRCAHHAAVRPGSSRTEQSPTDDEPMLVLSNDAAPDADCLGDAPPSLADATAPNNRAQQPNNTDVLRVLLRRLTPPPAYAP